MEVQLNVGKCQNFTSPWRYHFAKKYSKFTSVTQNVQSINFRIICKGFTMTILYKINFQNWFTITYFRVKNIESNLCAQKHNVVSEKFHRENHSFISMNRFHNLLCMVNMFFLNLTIWKSGQKMHNGRTV